MVARVIPKNYRNVTGRLASAKNQGLVGFESTLEKDFYTLLEFDRNVSHFEEQPVTITYLDPEGHTHRYTPDVLVYNRRAIVPAKTLPHLLCEVKYCNDLREHWKEYQARFKAAYRYARAKGWLFRLITERKVRTPLLNNARFLLSFRHGNVADVDAEQLLTTLAEQRETDPEALIKACSGDRNRQARLIPVLGCLLARRRIGADLDRLLTMHSRIWPVS